MINPAHYACLLTGQVQTPYFEVREVQQQKHDGTGLFDLHVSYLYSWAVSVIESGWKSSSTFLCILEKLTAPYVFILS